MSKQQDKLEALEDHDSSDVRDLLAAYRREKARRVDLQAALHAAYEEGKPAMAVRLSFLEGIESKGMEIRMLASCHPDFDDGICEAVSGALGAVLKVVQKRRENLDEEDEGVSS